MILRPYHNSSSKYILIVKKRSYELLKWLNKEDDSYFIPKQFLESYSKIVTLSDIKEDLLTLVKCKSKMFSTLVHLRLVSCDVLDETKTN